jgi:hypothetical protein
VGPADLAVRFWRIEPRVTLLARPLPSQEVRILIKEVSIAGLTVLILPDRERGGALPVDDSDRLRVEIKFGQDELLLEGRLRTLNLANLPDGFIQTGIAFRKPDSRLGALVGSLQRNELRLKRGIETPVPFHERPKKHSPTAMLPG